MIKFTEGGLIDIWPDKSSPEVQALSFALQNAMKMVSGYADRSQCYSRIDMLPEAILDYLAVEMRSMYYDQGAPIETKRAIIRNTMRWYTKAGTPSAVAEMIEVIFGVGEVVEWFDFTEPPYTRGTFDIVTSALMTAEIMEELTRLIKRVKNTRSHLRRVIVERELHSAVTAVITQVAVQETVVLNTLQQDNGVLNSGHYAVGYGAIQKESYALNTLNQEAAAEAGQYIALYGSTTDNRSTVTNEAGGTSKAEAEAYEASYLTIDTRETVTTNQHNGSSEASLRMYSRQSGVQTDATTTIKEE